MKTKLTVSISPEVLPRAKQWAKRRGVSLSSVIERTLNDLASEETPSFSAKWCGRFHVWPDCGEDARARGLSVKYLGEARP